MIEYPDAPNVGDIVTAENGAAWQWDGTAWVYVVAPPEGTVVQVGPAVGVISAWATSSPVPPDSLVCDGQPVPAGSAYDALRTLVGANVPDLRDRFLVGASSTRPPATVGGEATHILTPGEMPSHSHTMQQNPAHNHANPIQVADTQQLLPGAGYGGLVQYDGSRMPLDGSHTHTVDPTGGNGAHNNMPPFYAVVFIVQARATTAVLPAVAGAGGGGDGRSGFTYVTDEMPTPATAGETWFNSSTSAGGGSSYVAVDEGSGELVWVQFAPGSAGPISTPRYALLSGVLGSPRIDAVAKVVPWANVNANKGLTVAGGRVSIPAGAEGVYSMSASVMWWPAISWPSGPTGQWTVWITKNGVTSPANQTGVWDGSNWTVVGNCAGLATLVAGDYVEVFVNVGPAAHGPYINNSGEFQVVKVSGL